jgi:16S rRNA processing protein RimM
MSDRAGAPGRLEIGRLGAPHGLKGELRMTLHAGDDSALFDVEKVTAVLENGSERSLRIDGVRPSGRYALVRFVGVGDRDQAVALRGARVFVERSEVPALADGEYYLVDLVGLEVRGPDGKVGEVLGVSVNPSVNSVQVKLADGRVADVPLVPHWVRRVSIEERVLELSSLDGIIV